MNRTALLAASLVATAALGTAVIGSESDDPALATAEIRSGDDDTVIIEATNEHGEMMRIRADSIRLSDGDGEAQRDVFFGAEGQVVVRWVEQAPPPVRIGVLTEPVPEALASHLQVESTAALLIVEVVEDMPAARAGIQAHDVVVRVDDSAPVTSAGLRQVLASTQPGESIGLEIIRAGTLMTIDVMPQAWEEQEIEADRTLLQVPVLGSLMGSLEIEGADESGGVFLVETPVFVDSTVREQAVRGVPILTDVPLVATGHYHRPEPIMGFFVRDHDPAASSVRDALIVEIGALRERLQRLEAIVREIPVVDSSAERATDAPSTAP